MNQRFGFWLNCVLCGINFVMFMLTGSLFSLFVAMFCATVAYTIKNA